MITNVKKLTEEEASALIDLEQNLRRQKSLAPLEFSLWKDLPNKVAVEYFRRGAGSYNVTHYSYGTDRS
jgi:hypothetical protein